MYDNLKRRPRAEADYRYKFATKGKDNCPQCGRKTLVPYVDTETGEILPNKYGKCDRSDNCGYRCHPYADGYGKKLMSAITPVPVFNRLNPALAGSLNASASVEPSFISADLVKKYARRYNQSPLAVYLCGVLDMSEIPALAESLAAYGIGTSKDGKTIFWQIDANGKIRTGKMIAYAENGHRIKSVPPEWIHDRLKKTGKLDAFDLKQCLFGTHLIGRSAKPVHIVESEKTALIMSVLMSDFVWLATGGKQNFKLIEQAVPLLKGRHVTLFPDLGAFDDWSNKIKELSKANNSVVFRVSDCLEGEATDNDRKNGLDIADFALRLNERTPSAYNARETNLDTLSAVESTELFEMSANIDGCFNKDLLTEIADKLTDAETERIFSPETAPETAPKTAFSTAYPFPLYKEADNSTDLLPDWAKEFDWDAELYRQVVPVPF
jgi:hypothetical protein